MYPASREWDAFDGQAMMRFARTVPINFLRSLKTSFPAGFTARRSTVASSDFHVVWSGNSKALHLTSGDVPALGNNVLTSAILLIHYETTFPRWTDEARLTDQARGSRLGNREPAETPLIPPYLRAISIVGTVHGRFTSLGVVPPRDLPVTSG